VSTNLNDDTYRLVGRSVRGGHVQIRLVMPLLWTR
jgi:hypothetical protein